MTILEEMILETIVEDLYDWLDGFIDERYIEVAEIFANELVSYGESYGYDRMVAILPLQAHFVICQTEGRPA